MDSMSAREEISMLRAQLASLQTAFDAQALSRKRADEQYAMALSVGGGSGNGDGNGDGDRVDDGGASKPFDLSGVSQMEASVQQSFASMHSDFSRHLHLFPQDENIFQLNVDFIFQQRLHFGNQTVVYLAARRAPPHEPIAIKIIEDEHFSPEYPPQEVRWPPSALGVASVWLLLIFVRTRSDCTCLGGCARLAALRRCLVFLFQK